MGWVWIEFDAKWTCVGRNSVNMGVALCCEDEIHGTLRLSSLKFWRRANWKSPLLTRVHRRCSSRDQVPLLANVEDGAVKFTFTYLFIIHNAFLYAH